MQTMIKLLLLQMGGGMGGGGSLVFLGPLMGLLLVGGLVYLLWTAISGNRSPSKGDGTPGDATETLRDRYARGEIDDEEFEKRARKLREG